MYRFVGGPRAGTLLLPKEEGRDFQKKIAIG
jgi:hypothetical protein